MMRHAALLLLVLGQSCALKFGAKKPAADVEAAPAWEPYLELMLAHWKYAAAFLAVIILLLPKKKVAWLPFRRGRVLITGASEGLGKELARLLISKGHDVAFVARGKAKIDAAIHEILSYPDRIDWGGGFSCPADVTDGAALAAAVRKAEEEMEGPLDAVFCCAGAAQCGLFVGDDLSEADFEKQVALNYLGVVKTLRAVVPGMVERKKGTVVLVSSGLALCGYPGYAAYAPTKWAVRGLAEVLRLELLPFGINVHSAYPPAMDTPGFVNEEASKPPVCKTLEAGDAAFDPKAVAKSIVAAVDAGIYECACGDTFGIALLVRAASGVAPRATLVWDTFLAPILVVVGLITRLGWEKIVQKSADDEAIASAKAEYEAAQEPEEYFPYMNSLVSSPKSAIKED